MNKTTPDTSTVKTHEGSVGDTVQSIKQKGSEAIDQLKQKGSEAVDHLKQKGSEAVDHLKVRVVEITDEAKTKGMDFYDRAAALIKQKPFQAIGLAFGVGYLAMRINTSRLTPLAVLGGLGYLGAKLLRGEPLRSSPRSSRS